MQFICSRFNHNAWALALLVVIEVLTNFVSQELTVGRLVPETEYVPRAQMYSAWVWFIELSLLAAAILWTINHERFLRLAIFLINGIFTLQLFLASVLIVVRLLQSVQVAVSTLIVDAVILFVTNILIFGLWYWFLETGNTRLGKDTAGPAWDFLFPQRQGEIPGYENWKPHFIDYIFVAYTTSVAFSPTDTLPLSRAAKLLMIGQSAISLITIVVVAGTAINILAGNA